jgi:HAD superfamily hydrolase (TIGR01509 family)
MLAACFFDLDGTLVDSERENAESIAIVLAARGRALTEEERLFVVGHGWREIYDHLAGHGGVDLSFAALKEAAAAAKEELCRGGLRTIPGAVAFVRHAARALDGRTALVSGSSRREVDFCIRALGLERELRLSVAAEDVARGKPSPEGYLAAAARLGVDPQSAVVFEDSRAGILAAREAGMYTVAVAAANFAGEDQGAAHLRVADFNAPEVREALDEAFWAGR